MTKLTKRRKLINEKVTAGKIYSVEEALQILIDLSNLKFVESVDVAINLGVNPKQSDQVVRGRIGLPNGTGRTGKRIAVFAKGEAAEAAKANGAALVGFEDLAEEIKKQGKIEADIVLATPDAMRVVGTLGPILGPRGLMPNPKEGTVTNEIANAMANVLNGVRFRTDKNGIIHCTIGTIKMSANALRENLSALLSELRKQKPSTAKGAYFKRMTLSTTMGPGILVDVSPFVG